MFNFIKSLFARFTSKTYATGAFENPPDNRDIITSNVQAPIVRPKKLITDLSMFDVFDQGALGTCVAHCLVLYKMWLDFKETGKIVVYSRRWLYALARAFSGFIESMGQGLIPRDAAKVVVNTGLIADKGLDDNTLPHEAYCALPVTQADRDEANITRAKSFASVENDQESLAQAVAQNGLVAISMPYAIVQWTSGWVRQVLSFIFRHYVLVYGYEEQANGDIMFFFRNSWAKIWGFSGNGQFLYSEFKDTLKDMLVFLDLPNDVLKRTKDTRYIFLRDLKIGATGDDVRRLQQYLNVLELLDDAPTGYFGVHTQAAVKQYQSLHGIEQTGNFYPITRGVMNLDNKADPALKSKLDLWVEAIEKMEGANPAYNNPFDIKYFGQAGCKAAANGICIYPTYADGYIAGRNLLLRAATGLSTNYKPDETLLEFFAGRFDGFGHKLISGYAPASDNNDPQHYAEVVAAHIATLYPGITPSTMIKDLV